MDIKKYIASGILEQYAFGMLSPAERSVVEANLQQYPELVDELRKIEGALEQYLSAGAVPPSEGFRAQLDEHLSQVEPDPAPVTTASTNTSPNWWLIGFSVLSFAIAAWLWYSNYQQEQAHQQLQQEFNILQADCDETNEVNRGLLEQLRTIRQSGSSIIQMRTTGVGAEDAIAAVVYNAESETTHLDPINLAALADGQQYQLWAIVKDVGPQSMAVFDAPTNAEGELLEVPFFENVEAFAITIEPQGGSDQPTLDQMVVIGVAS